MPKEDENDLCFDLSVVWFSDRVPSLGFIVQLFRMSDHCFVMASYRRWNHGI